MSDTADTRLQKASSRAELLDIIKDLLKNEEPLTTREFYKISPPKNTDVRVMQWNMLAQALSCSDDGFIKCPLEALQWPKRRLYILQEILHYDADIICLEEVDQFNFLNEILSKIGYEGHFRSKLNSPCLYAEPNYGPDGCACFWKKEKLSLIKKTDFVLTPDSEHKNQVGLFLSFKLGNAQFGVVATHLKAKPAYSERRLEQALSILEYLNENASNLGVVICGDFNGTFDEPFYQEFTKSELNLLSTYRKLSAKGEEPDYTTWKVRPGKNPGDPEKEVCRTIDYIWCSQEKFEVCGLLKLPTENEVGPGRLPSPRYPSDHISLVANLRLKNV